MQETPKKATKKSVRKRAGTKGTKQAGRGAQKRAASRSASKPVPLAELEPADWTVEELQARTGLKVAIGVDASGRVRTVTMRRLDFMTMVLEGLIPKPIIRACEEFFADPEAANAMSDPKAWVDMEASKLKGMLTLMRTFVCAASLKPKFVTEEEYEEKKEPGTAPVTLLTSQEVMRAFGVISGTTAQAAVRTFRPRSRRDAGSVPPVGENVRPAAKPVAGAGADAGADGTTAPKA